MSETMVKVYYKLICAGVRTIEQVPEELKKEVEKLLLTA